MKTTIGVFDTTHDAERAVQMLERAGFEANDISLTVRDTNLSADESGDTTAGGSSRTDTATGTVAGGLTGLSVGAAAGTGLGAVPGGLVDVLSGMGAANDPAPTYGEGARRGGVLVAVHTDELRLGSAEKILRENGAVDPDRANPTTGNPIRVNPIRADPTSNSSVPGSGGATDPVTGENYAKSSKLGTAAGTVSGAATGAFVGSAGGPIGTIVGGVIGAVVGGGLGAGLDAAAKSEQGQTLAGTGETRETESTSGWHDRTINSDEDERERQQDTTGLAGASLEDSIQGTVEAPLPDRPGSSVEERLKRAKSEAEAHLRGRID